MHIAKLEKYTRILVSFDLICWATITPMGVFWAASEKSKRRVMYTAQMVFILLVTVAAVSLWVLHFFPLNYKKDDRRSPTANYPVIYFAALGCLLVPRIMQAQI
ncbi:unnamed protein product [Vitrella brassicaformis CCMP3155]|uniref:Uncharacterized protein n=1 Tax=Vitrella brassicaformis (strain CCMP3155) TaxID=1169540 RepID=A0A0G4EHC0_VITBC|nr:unnamed protein product [Vitrella brassicaformis CCMP3155]|eukprot:CEL95425.1 unnamed protein product [Vitrella brassicaformis CCMP3155]